ncbi:hypothetical protein AA0616_2083 [Komagataeibacter nataicola NRIC 0616]|nr:hypothetical protein AA0616_2083 [Komagataeibacter nataicola NRIC 0616]
MPEVGGLLLFWGLGALGLGLYASAAVILFVIGDGIMRWWRGLDFPRVWLLFNGLALILALLGPVVCAGRMNVRIEPVLTSYLVGIVFMIGALGRKPIVQDIAEQRQGAPFAADRHDLRMFFRVFTWVWAAYFLIRGSVYLWLAHTMPSGRMGLLENIISPASLVAMILVSSKGKALFQLGCRAGIFTVDRRA